MVTIATPYHLFETLKHLHEMCTKCPANIYKMLIILALGNCHTEKQMHKNA